MAQPMYTLQSIASIINAQTIGASPAQVVDTLVIDSRMVTQPLSAVFFAVKAQRNGHDFIKDAYQRGVRAFVVSESGVISHFADANFLVVKDTLAALQLLVSQHRLQFAYPVLGITGSNGKTIVKEWLYQLLADDFNIIKNPKSFNSQLGVPLAVWQMDHHHSLGIFEAGISKPGEMQNLEAIIKPTIGVFTNLGDAHASGFVNDEQKLAEKWKLFENVNLLVYSPDHLPVSPPAIKADMFTWSFFQKADLQVVKTENKQGFTQITARFAGQQFIAQVNFTDKASVENSVACWATLLALGYKNEVIIPRLRKLDHLKMRLKLINGIENCSVIDDSYSADIASLSIALDFLNQQNQHPQKTLILSDFAESGKSDGQLYSSIAQLLKEKRVDRLIGIGEKVSANASIFKLSATFFDSVDSFIAQFNRVSFGKETILVKGARRFGFERITKLLTQKMHDTVLEVDLNALAANVQYYRAKLQPGVKMMAMVKAFSYGNGSFEIANLLQFGKMDYLAVAYADEGIALRKAGITLPIMVMSPSPSAFESIVRHRLEPELYNFNILRAFLPYLEEGEPYPVHIKLDTGMHRLGFEHAEIQDLAQTLSQEKRIQVVSVFSHLVGSDSAMHDDFTQHQIDLYLKMYAQLTHGFAEKPIRHLVNTSGITRWPSAQLDMVRLGIGMYGYDSAFSDASSPLQTVASLKTTVTQVKHLLPGETVGYARKGALPHGGSIATVKIGYADGYLRAFGNGVGHMLLHGKLVPTIGAICMDMTMLDVSGLPVQAGDEVLVFGEELPVQVLARQIGTIPYEILTSVSQRVKREYMYD